MTKAYSKQSVLDECARLCKLYSECCTVTITRRHGVVTERIARVGDTHVAVLPGKSGHVWFAVEGVSETAVVGVR